jgi:hypothetical protein
MHLYVEATLYFMHLQLTTVGARAQAGETTGLARILYVAHIGQHQRTTRGHTLPLSAIHQPFVLSTRIMSQTLPTASSSSSNFQSVLNVALEAYQKKTKCNLLTQPLAAQLQSCDSPTAVLSVLQDLIQQFDRRRSSDQRLSNWLNPTINVLYAFSSTLGQGVGLVSPISTIFLESVT